MKKNLFQLTANNHLTGWNMFHYSKYFEQEAVLCNVTHIETVIQMERKAKFKYINKIFFCVKITFSIIKCSRFTQTYTHWSVFWYRRWFNGCIIVFSIDNSVDFHYIIDWIVLNRLWWYSRRYLWINHFNQDFGK